MLAIIKKLQEMCLVPPPAQKMSYAHWSEQMLGDVWPSKLVFVLLADNAIPCGAASNTTAYKQAL